LNAFKDLVVLRTSIMESLVVVFFAFVLHELAHRIAARRYGFHAVFHVWIPGLILAMGGALIGLLFAAPGGVYIQAPNTVENRAKLGKSALVGPVVNMVLAVIFAVFTLVFIAFIQSYTTSSGASLDATSWVKTVEEIGVMGLEINALLAFFNLIPWGFFDGFKVFQWNKKVWIIAFIASILLFVLTFFV
jgi:Zn-dependent protease